MAILVRKIEFAKWVQRNILEGEQPSADAITRCMRTTGNKLSLWSIDDESELEEAVLAIVAQGDHVDTIDVLSIDHSLFEDKKLPLEVSPGLTPYSGFAERHLDVTELDYVSLGLMAEVIVESIRRNRWERFREQHLVRILADAVDRGKVQLSDLKQNVQKKILASRRSREEEGRRPYSERGCGQSLNSE